MDDVEQMGEGRDRNRGLSVSRSSKIAKSMRRPAAQQRPPPSVYNTHPEDFRNLVQKLTGATLEQQQPVNPTATSARAINVRLQSIAPRPLQAISAHAALPQSPRLSHPNLVEAHASEGAYPPLSQRHNLGPVLSPWAFSPLAALTPGDSIWASMESPLTANLRQLAGQLVAENEGGEYRWDGMGGRSSPQSLISPVLQSSALLANQMGVAAPGIYATSSGIDASSNTLPADFPLDLTTLPGPEFTSGLR